MNTLPFIHIRIALRNILRHRRRSLLTIAAVAFGIFCLIVFQALKTGLHDKMLESSLGLDMGGIQIHAPGYEMNMPLLRPLPEPETISDVLDRLGLHSSSAPRVKTTALILAGKRSSSVILSGIAPDREAGVTFIHRTIRAGNYVPAPGTLLMGKALATSLDLRPGDPVDILAQDSFGQPARTRLTVGGLFESGLRRFDLAHVYLSIDDARTFLDTEPNDVTEIAIGTRPEAVDATVAKLHDALAGLDLQIRTYRELAPDLVQLMELNNATFNLLIIIVFTIVAMGIANTMTTVIFERFRELGTLAALGTNPGQIVFLIVAESALLGMMAALLGSMAAVLACSWLAVHGIDLSHFTSSNQYFAAGSLLRARLAAGDILTANAVTLLTALAAGIFPAIRAARMKPVDALRSV